MMKMTLEGLRGLSGQRKAEAAVTVPFARVVGAPEAIKEKRHIVLRELGRLVGDGDLLRVEFDFDAAFGWGVFDGVAEQIGEDDAQQAWIGVDGE